MMFNKTRLSVFIIVFTALCQTINLSNIYYTRPADKIIDDNSYRFTIKLFGDWDMRDTKETKDKDGISYSLERKDKKVTVMILAFKLSSVKNFEDFIYNLEKDIALNIPQKSGDYSEKDHGTYDEKSAIYKDDKYEEVIYYFRTKLPDATNNYVYMVRFITETKNFSSDVETSVKGIAETFKSTAE